MGEGEMMDRVDRLFQIFDIDPVKDKAKYRRCQRRFLAVRYEDRAVRFYGSYNVRCKQPLTECVNCRHVSIPYRFYFNFCPSYLRRGVE